MPIFEFTLFSFRIAPTYYGLAYAIGFIAGYEIVKRRGIFDSKNLDSLLMYVFLGVILGGRFGYVAFYNLPYYLEHPMKVLAFWEGGMSFHGGVIGVIVALLAFAWKNRFPLLQVSDEVTAILPVGIGLGRVANYINGELSGFAGYYGPLAMKVGNESRFPSPLLEAVLEGPVLFLILLLAQRRSKKPGTVSAAFLIGYSVFRILIEFVRLPDPQIGYFFGVFTLGQILSVPMLLLGLYLLRK